MSEYLQMAAQLGNSRTSCAQAISPCPRGRAAGSCRAVHAMAPKKRRAAEPPARGGPRQRLRQSQACRESELVWQQQVTRCPIAPNVHEGTGRLRRGGSQRIDGRGATSPNPSVSQASSASAPGQQRPGPLELCREAARLLDLWSVGELSATQVCAAWCQCTIVYASFAARELAMRFWAAFCFPRFWVPRGPVPEGPRACASQQLLLTCTGAGDSRRLAGRRGSLWANEACEHGHLSIAGLSLIGERLEPRESGQY
jgi:hypothetical protein